jgi:predicted GIY-YIG superfamily endonuclease
MWYVYILESESHTGKFYTGFTHDLKRRFAEHNAEGNSGHTTKYTLWKLYTYIAFSNKKTAQDFEAYLKTQAGCRFQKLRFEKK